MKILTSTGLSTKSLFDLLKTLNSSARWKTACIIVSAQEAGSEDRYVKLAVEQLTAIGITKIDFIDFFNQEIAAASDYDLVYISGGNTFRLLQSIQGHKNGLMELKSILENKDVIGVSAGSVLLTPTIRIASEVEPDEYVEVSNFDALEFVPFEIYPHYDAGIEKEISEYEKKHTTVVSRLTNESYLLTED